MKWLVLIVLCVLWLYLEADACRRRALNENE